MQTTVCPVKVLEGARELDEVVEWFLRSATFEPWTGGVSGPPEWPRPGGVLRQDARLVAAVDLLRAEMAFLRERPVEDKPGAGKSPSGGRRRRAAE